MKSTKQRNTLILCLGLCSILALMLAWIIFDKTVDRSGWVEKEGTYFYRDFHGRKITGWLETDGNTYYFGEDHAMVTGWLELEGNRYYLGSDGILYKGWKTVDTMRCYFGENGVLHTGWLDLGEKRYYLDPEGALVSGWLELEGKKYYFGETGAMSTGLTVLEGCTYYFEETGELITGRITLDGRNYYFQDNGMMYTGWEETENGRRFYDPDGVQALGWAEIDGKHYFFNEEGLTPSGWYQDGEYRYYLLEDGSAATGPMEIEEQQYYFTPKGIQVVLVNGDHSVPEYYEPTLVEYIPWHQVADVALEPLTNMLEDCKEAGYDYEFNSAYRSIQVQEEILSLRTQEHMNLGYSQAAAYAKARETVALPGTSEHHLGLAVDVLNVASAEKKALDWLGTHCWEYGFILRYAEDKADITGIIHEPWHFRYVGTRVSMDMKDSGLCLEEYLGADAVSNSTINEENN